MSERVAGIVAYHDGENWQLSTWSGKVHDIWVRLPVDASPFDVEAVVEWQRDRPEWLWRQDQAYRWARVLAFLSSEKG